MTLILLSVKKMLHVRNKKKKKSSVDLEREKGKTTEIGGWMPKNYEVDSLAREFEGL